MTNGNAIVIGTTTKYRTDGNDNMGNVVHAASARRILKTYKEFPTSRPWTDEEIERAKDHSHIVVVMANALRLGRVETPLSPHHAVMRRNIEATNLPVVVFGLGAQAPIDGTTELIAPTETMNLLRVISDRSRRIAVRGEFTADTLRRLGINNPEVIGCQSCFLSKSQHFPFALEKKPSGKKVAFNYTNAHTEAPLIAKAIENKWCLFGQTEYLETWLQSSADADSLPEKFERTAASLKKAQIDLLGYRDFCSSSFCKFGDFDEWAAEIASYDISFGTRFHGNMIALQSGVPSLWLVHDRRTRELCDYLMLPNITVKQALDTRNIDDLYNHIDYGPFLRSYPERYRKFRSYVVDAGLPHNLGDL